MHNVAMVSAGIACLLIGMFATFRLAPRSGQAGVAWMEREGVAMGAILAVLMLLYFGAALLLKGI